MAFSQAVAEELLLKCMRRCCVCQKFKGTSIEVHHIDPTLDKGRDELDNGIPLCIECHGIVGHYNDRHPRGRKYRPSELRKLKDHWFAAIAEHGMQAGDASDDSSKRTPSVQQHVAGNGNVVAGGDILINSRKTVKTTFAPGSNHIAEATAVQLKNLVDEIAELEKQTRKPPHNPHGKWWAKLKRHFNVATYRAIPREQGDEAVRWLQTQKALLRPKLRRAAADTWRQQYYAAIFARSKEIGIDKESLYELATTRLELPRPIVSLKELGEQQLKRLHQIIFNLQTGRTGMADGF